MWHFIIFLVLNYVVVRLIYRGTMLIIKKQEGMYETRADVQSRKIGGFLLIAFSIVALILEWKIKIF